MCSAEYYIHSRFSTNKMEHTPLHTQFNRISPYCVCMFVWKSHWFRLILVESWDRQPASRLQLPPSFKPTYLQHQYTTKTMIKREHVRSHTYQITTIRCQQDWKCIWKRASPLLSVFLYIPYDKMIWQSNCMTANCEMVYMIYSQFSASFLLEGVVRSNSIQILPKICYNYIQIQICQSGILFLPSLIPNTETHIYSIRRGRVPFFFLFSRLCVCVCAFGSAFRVNASTKMFTSPNFTVGLLNSVYTVCIWSVVAVCLSAICSFSWGKLTRTRSLLSLLFFLCFFIIKGVRMVRRRCFSFVVYPYTSGVLSSKHRPLPKWIT